MFNKTNLLYLAYELHQLASTSNEYFSIVLNFLRSSMGTRYLKTILKTSPDQRRSGAWERLGKKTDKSKTFLILRIILGRLYGLMTSLVPLSRRIQILKEVLFTKVRFEDRQVSGCWIPALPPLAKCRKISHLSPKSLSHQIR